MSDIFESSPSPLDYADSTPEREIFYAELTDPTRSPISVHPVEIIVRILTFACGPLFDRYNKYMNNVLRRRRFLDNRTAFMLVCQQWCWIILNYGGFWREYIVRPLKAREPFIRWTSLMRSRPIDIWVDLDSCYLRTAPDDDELSVQDVIDFVVRKAPLCSRLTISADDDPVFTAFTEALRHVDFPELKELALLSNSLNIIPPSQLANLPAPGAFEHPLRPSSTLRICGFALRWNNPPFYSRLDTLILSYLSGTAAPTIPQLYGILDVTAQLRRLSLKSVDSAGPCSRTSTLVLDELTHFHLAASKNMLFGPLLGLISAPRLSNLAVEVEGQEDLLLFLDCPSLIASVTHLTVDGYHVPDDHIRMFYFLMPKVVSVDLVMSGRNYLLALTDGALWPPVWPHLKYVYFSDVRFQEIQLLFDKRQSAEGSIEFMSLYYTYRDVLKAEQRSWVQERVGRLELTKSWRRRWYTSNI